MSIARKIRRRAEWQQLPRADKRRKWKGIIFARDEKSLFGVAKTKHDQHVGTMCKRGFEGIKKILVERPTGELENIAR